MVLQSRARLCRVLILKASCVFYHLLEERLVRTDKTTYWVKELEVKTDIPFFVKDETGSVMIDPIGAEMDLPVRYSRTEGIKRYRECNIMQNETVYVLGTVKVCKGREERIQEEVESRLQEMIDNPEEKIKLDINKDMWIDEEERRLAKEKIIEQVRREFEDIKNTLKQGDYDTPEHFQNKVIGKGELVKHFLISNRSEKELVGSYNYKVFFSILEELYSPNMFKYIYLLYLSIIK